MQKRAARIILGAEYITKTVTMFNKLNWIPYYNEAYINRCGMAFKRINDNTHAAKLYNRNIEDKLRCSHTKH